MRQCDTAIIGGGIVGLATAMAMVEAGHPSLLVLEAEDRLAAHQSGRNSGVIHAGLYYRPGSLKARLCVEGREALYRFCEEHGIPCRRCGKVVVATSERELAALDASTRIHVLGGDTVRVKLWAPDGTIVYSDEPSLIGEQFALLAPAADQCRRSGKELWPVAQAGRLCGHHHVTAQASGLCHW